jgi:hypothetical protein
MCKLIEWPHYDQANAFQFNKVIKRIRLPAAAYRSLAREGGHASARAAQQVSGDASGKIDAE